MADIFSPWRLRDLTLANRLVRSATYEGLADPEGIPTTELALVLGELAEGGVGLIVTGFMFVSPTGRALARQTGAHIDAVVGPLTRVADAVHKAGGRVAAQLVHAGALARSELIGTTPLAPSELRDAQGRLQAAALSREQIYDIIEDFALAAARVRAAGFDALQLHVAHGYLLNQFLSPRSNRREDEYGGDIAGRSRLLLEVYRAVREVVGPRFPVLVKLNSHDGVEEGLDLPEALETARLLDAEGIDAVEVSGGTPASPRDKAPARAVETQEEEGYFLDAARAVKRVVSCPVISVGGWRSRERIEAALETVDAVALSRPLIRQPHLPRLWQEGRREPAACISCNRCFVLARREGLGCAQERRNQG
jgi:2,4-dienoyl-CoA reductase-like NADH-dependent reductase (Old Yellow Enzyme family)